MAKEIMPCKGKRDQMVEEVGQLVSDVRMFHDLFPDDTLPQYVAGVLIHTEKVCKKIRKQYH